MGDVAYTAADIRVMDYHRAIVNPYQANSAIAVGDFVYEVSTGKVDQADANVSAAVAAVIGIVVESFDGETAIAAGNFCSVCEFGEVTGFSSLTIGALTYLSNTVKRGSTTAGAFTRIIGRNISATTIRIAPVLSDAVSV